MSTLKLFLKSKKYFASASLYSCFSLMFSTWVTYIPFIAEKLELSEGRVGNAIFFSALGAFIMIRISRNFIDSVGVGKFTYYAFLIYCLFFYGPFLANDYTSLCISLFLTGMASSAFAISLNSLIATIEKQDGVYVMSASHGFWSIGGMIGSATGGIIAAQLQNPVLHISALLLVLVAFQTKFKNRYLYRIDDPVSDQKKGKSIIKPLFIIAFVGLIVMVSEGALADWSALYLKKIVLIEPEYIGFGYSAFSMAMMIGRFSGDSLSQKMGSWKLLTFVSLLSVVGFSMVLVINSIISILGFFVVGLGFSVVVPEVYRLASNVKGVKTSDGVSFIAATTNIGFLLGPVTLGYIAEIKSLHLSFIVLTAFVSFAFFISLFKFTTSKSTS